MNFNISERDPAWLPSKKDPPWNTIEQLKATGGRFFFGIQTTEGFKAFELQTKEEYNEALVYLKHHANEIEHYSFYLLPPFNAQLWLTASDGKFK